MDYGKMFMMFMASGLAGMAVYSVLASLSNVHEKLISTPVEAAKLGGAICVGLLVFSAGLQTMHLGAIEYIPAAILMLIISYPIGFGAGFMLWSILPESSRKTLADFFLHKPAPQPTKSSLSAVHWIGILIVLPLIAFGIMFIAMFSHDTTREKTQSVQPPTVAPQQSSPPIQTNSGSGLPPCIGTKAATWTNCTGTANWPDGGTYAGEWGGGKMHGQGTRTLPDGAKYIGEYRDDTPHGQGTLTGPDGQKYVGEWRSGKMHGQGTRTLLGGQKFVGEYKDGMPNGQGTHTWPDGKKYVGEFRDDKMHGQGTLMFPDGAKFVGEYKDGKRNGQGTLTLPDGSVGYSGMWADDAPVE